MQGLTISEAVFILDEAQNASLLSTYMALSRIGTGTKMIITGDPAQCTLRDKKDSGFDFFKKLELEKLPGFEIIELKSNHRDEVVDLINKIYLDYKD
jgi:phosphate starvation-inducible PhoH-like protein